jgi:hypothetical protein
MSAIVILFLDAFSFNHVNKFQTPFLSEQTVHSLAPAFGFKQLAAAFTGESSFATQWFAEFSYDSQNSPFRWTRLIPHRLISEKSKYTKFYSERLSRAITGSSVPLRLSSFFTVDRSPFSESSRVVSLLQRNEISYRFVFNPEVRTNQQAFNLTCSILGSHGAPDVLLVHFPELDPVGHSFGNKSKEVKHLVHELDQMIASIYERVGEDSQIIAFSDHGMVDVKGHINILQKISDIGEIGKDYVVFLDSIMARFWFINESLIEPITKLLTSDTRGCVLRPKNRNQIKNFGHMMFLCSPGYIVLPNYYDVRIPKSMHGYNTAEHSNPEIDGIFLSNNPEVVEKKSQLQMTDIASILTNSIERLL